MELYEILKSDMFFDINFYNFTTTNNTISSTNTFEKSIVNFRVLNKSKHFFNIIISLY